jgi:hypothetical protein
LPSQLPHLFYRTACLFCGLFYEAFSTAGYTVAMVRRLANDEHKKDMKAAA